MNQSSPVPNHATPDPEAHSTVSRGDKSGVRYHICEIKGNRPSQEDYYFVKDCNVRTGHGAHALLEHAFEDAAEKTSNPRVTDKQGKTWIDGSGSCATVAILTPDRTLTVANLGDSPAILYVMHAKGDVIPYRLNVLHKPDVPEEKKYIESGGGKVENGVGLDRAPVSYIRIPNGRLAVSRAFGDKAFGKLVSKTPSISQIDIDEYVKPGDKAFLCVSCDGLFEKGATPEDYAKIIREHIYNPHSNIAELMQDHASNNVKSNDNITVILAEIPPPSKNKEKNKEKKSVAFGVFDGHLGISAGNPSGNNVANQVSSTIGKHMGSDGSQYEKRVCKIKPTSAPSAPPLSHDDLAPPAPPIVVEGTWTQVPTTGEYHLLITPLFRNERERIKKQVEALGIPLDTTNSKIWIVPAEHAEKLKQHLPRGLSR